MLGEGMPWHIILIFFVVGILFGIRSGKKELKSSNAQKRTSL